MPMSPLTRNSVRLQRLIVALTIALLGTLVGIFIFIDFQHVRQNEEDRLETQATLVSTNLELHMSSANQVMEEILALLDFAEAEQQLERMQSLVNAMPIIRGIGIVDSQGLAVVNTRRVPQGTDLSDRPYFRNVLGDPQRQRLYISTPFRGVTGVVSIALSKAIFDRQNTFQGVIYAVLDPEYIERLLNSTLYTTDMWAALMHMRSGDAVRVGALWSESDPHAASGAALRARLPLLMGDRSATLAHDNGRLGSQLVAASTISSYAGNAERPLLVVTGRNYSNALAAWRRIAYLQALLFTLIALTAGAGLLFYQHRRRQYDARRAADQSRVRAREQDYRIIVERTADCVVKLDRHGDFSYVNPAYCAVFGLPSSHFLGRSFFSQILEDDLRQAQASLGAVLQEPSEQRFQVRCMTPVGPRHMEWTLCSISGDDGAISSIIGVSRDMSAHVAMRDELRNRAHHDSLTGLINRGHFTELGAAEIGRSQRYGQPLSLMMLDLDHFKKVNDTRGHQAGDVALQTCAHVLGRECREFDIAARLGGEEFTVLLPNTALHEAMQAAERMRVAISQQPVLLEGGDAFHLTTSVGVAEIQPEETLESLLRRADAALYAAKQSGRNRVRADVPSEAPIAG